jgi:heme oxygenase
MGNRGRLQGSKSKSVRETLRAATADLHAAIDARFAPLIGAGAAGYREFLGASAAAIVPLERALGAANVRRILPDWAQRARTEALLADLADLQSEPPAEQALAAVPDMSTEAFQFGVLYVLEGSRLGARILLRHVQQDGDPRVRSATRYLRHGEGGGFWRGYLDRLEASAAVTQDPDGAVAGAQTAFALFGAGAALNPRASGEFAGARHAE